MADFPERSADKPVGQADFRAARAWIQYQYVDVVFNGTANGNTDIRHELAPPSPELVDYEIVDMRLAAAPGTAPIIYRDSAATHRPWGTGYIVLRSNVASLAVTLRLTVRSTL